MTPGAGDHVTVFHSCPAANRASPDPASMISSPLSAPYAAMLRSWGLGASVRRLKRMRLGVFETTGTVSYVSPPSTDR